MKYKYWLASIIGISNEVKRTIVSLGITAEELYYMEEDKINQLELFSRKQIDLLNKSRKNMEINKEWNNFLEKGIEFTTIEDDNFPEKLKNISNCPYSIFFAGKLPETNKMSVSIVGARGRSAYGCEVAKKLGEVLAKNGINVISGLARGIDKDGHTGALQGKGNTFAVLGSGVDICYPRENKYLYEEIKKTGGIISEFLPGTNPIPLNFPLRNRIISGLSDIVVVVEAKLKSGSLITADFAMEQGRDVYVVPGRITDPLSKGCNRLIKQGAGIIYDIEEFVSDITETAFTECVQMDFKKNLLDKKESLVYSLLDFCPVGIGTLFDKLPFDLSELLDILENLKRMGYIKEDIPNHYIKCI